MKNIVIATSVALLMSTTAFATDCKYVKNIVLSNNGSILSSTTNYVCKESQPIVILEPTVKNVRGYKRPPPRSFSQIRNIALGY